MPSLYIGTSAFTAAALGRLAWPDKRDSSGAGRPVRSRDVSNESAADRCRKLCREHPVHFLRQEEGDRRLLIFMVQKMARGKRIEPPALTVHPSRRRRQIFRRRALQPLSVCGLFQLGMDKEGEWLKSML